MENLNKLSDDKLLSLYVNGNNDAFDVIIRRYESKVFSYIAYSVKNQELAEDIFQDTFVKAIYAIQQGKYAENGGKHDNSVEDPFAGAEDVEREQAEKRRNSYVPEGGYLTYYETRVLLTYLENRARLASPVTYDRKFAEFIFEKSGQQRPKKLNRNKTFSFIRDVARYHAWLHGILGGVRV